MARPEPWQLDPASYPHIHAMQTRFQDLDMLGHINNVAMAGLFENGRARFNQAIGMGAQDDCRWFVAAVEINYLAEGRFPDDVEIASGIGEIGTRSWHILLAAFQGGVPIATCDTVLVVMGSEGATAMPDDFRAALEKHRVHPA